MFATINKCCCFIQLRIGCMIIGSVGIQLGFLNLFAIVYSGLVGLQLMICASASIIWFNSSIIGNGCLIYAAANNKASAQSRSIAVLIYLVMIVVQAIVTFGLAIVCFDVLKDLLHYSVPIFGWLIYIFLYMYFGLVSYSFYRELKGGNINADEYARKKRNLFIYEDETELADRQSDA